MVDLSIITGAVGSLKTAVDIAKTVKEINDLSVVRDKVIQMQDLIISAQVSAVSAQAQLMEVMQENAELKSKVSAIEEWKATAARYQLVDYGGSTLAYELKAEAAQGEPMHRLCPNCFEQRRRSILQFSHPTASHQQLYKCIPCCQNFTFGNRQSSQPTRVKRNNGWMA